MSDRKRKQPLVPKLRFPEFRDAGEWEVRRLSDALVFQAGFPFSSSGFNEKHEGLRLIRNRDLKSDDKTIFYSGSFKEQYIVHDGDVLIGMDGDFTPCVWNKGKALLNQRVGRIFANKGRSHNFVYYLLTLQLRAIEAATARTTVKHLSHSSVENILAPIPQLKEQQKIASCLGSLDELIELEAKKHEALKAHKKGLMQQLFPQEGETTPHLRFSEFRDAGEWGKIQLGAIGRVSMCKRVMKHETREKGDVPFYKIGTFGKQADAFINNGLYEDYKNKYPFPKKGDILISAAGTIGRLVVYDGSPAYFQDSNIVWIDNDESIVINPFLFYCYEKTNWKTDDNTIPRLYNDNIRNIWIIAPSIQEQQKITDCLASLDELIALQAQKVEALKIHKKGLMQQLFPQEVA